MFKSKIQPKLKELFVNNEYLYLILAFFIPFGIMGLIYIAMNVFPFGDNSVLVLDLNGQYVYFFEAFRDFLVGENSILYSWGRALGGEFMGIYAYYLASPFSFIVALFPKSMITEALLCIILCKVGACGFSFGYYLHTSHPTKKVNIIIFSILYALSSYAVVQQHNTMWIDGLIFLPLILLGVEKVICEGKYILYTVSLALMMMAHFYIGFMICIFTVFYFFYYYIANNENNENNFLGEKYHFIKSIMRIGLFSIIALSIAMIIVYPAYYSLTFGKTTFSKPNYMFEQKFDFLDMFTKLFPGSYDTVRPEGLPFIYSGTLALILLPIYFISSHIKAREKMMSGLILAFLIFSFNSSTIDLVWHGFQKPNWLNYRYSFIFCFMVILFAYKAFEHLEKVDFKWIVFVCGILGVILMVMQKQDYKLPDIQFIWISIACISFTLLALHAVNKGYLKDRGPLILAIVVCMEMFTSGLLNITSLDNDVHFSSRLSYTNFLERFSPMVEIIKRNDDSFYRMEKTVHRKTNDAMALGFRGLSNSTSTLNASTVKFLNQMGYSSKSHWSKYLGGTPVSDSLLGLKYIISDEKLNDSLYLQKYKSEDLFAYQNPYALSLAFGVNDLFQSLDITLDEFKSPLILMNKMVSSMLDSKYIELFKPIETDDMDYDNCDVSYTTGHKKYAPKSEGKKSRVYFNMKAIGNNELFCFFPSEYPREVELKLNGSDYSTYFGNETDRIVSLGTYKNNESVSLSMTLTKEDLYLANGTPYFYYLDTELFKEIIPQLQECMLKITSYTEDNLKGTIDIKEGRTTLFTSIPYDEGWIIKIDGEKMPLIKTLDALIAVEIPVGTHDVQLQYLPKCFTLGLTSTVCGVILFSLIIVVDVYFKRRKK